MLSQAELLLCYRPPSSYRGCPFFVSAPCSEGISLRGYRFDPNRSRKRWIATLPATYLQARLINPPHPRSFRRRRLDNLVPLGTISPSFILQQSNLQFGSPATFTPADLAAGRPRHSLTQHSLPYLPDVSSPRLACATWPRCACKCATTSRCTLPS